MTTAGEAIASLLYREIVRGSHRGAQGRRRGKGRRPEKERERERSLLWFGHRSKYVKYCRYISRQWKQPNRHRKEGKRGGRMLEEERLVDVLQGMAPSLRRGSLRKKGKPPFGLMRMLQV
jgi:hypothetical protein